MCICEKLWMRSECYRCDLCCLQSYMLLFPSELCRMTHYTNAVSVLCIHGGWKKNFINTTAVCMITNLLWGEWQIYILNKCSGGNLYAVECQYINVSRYDYTHRELSCQTQEPAQRSSQISVRRMPFSQHSAWRNAEWTNWHDLRQKTAEIIIVKGHSINEWKLNLFKCLLIQNIAYFIK